MSETLSEAIGADHAAFDEYADNIRNATTDLDKIKWRNQLTWTVARHAISEELTWYPAMEKHLGMEGTKLAHEDKAGHAAVSNPSMLSCPVLYLILDTHRSRKISPNSRRWYHLTQISLSCLRP